MSKEAIRLNVLGGYTGRARLYYLSESVPWIDSNSRAQKHETNYVVIVELNEIGIGLTTEIFPADEDGTVLDWTELPGSLMHEQADAALTAMGYLVADYLPESEAQLQMRMPL